MKYYFFACLGCFTALMGNVRNIHYRSSAQNPTQILVKAAYEELNDFGRVLKTITKEGFLTNGQDMFFDNKNNDNRLSQVDIAIAMKNPQYHSFKVVKSMLIDHGNFVIEEAQDKYMHLYAYEVFKDKKIEISSNAIRLEQSARIIGW